MGCFRQFVVQPYLGLFRIDKTALPGTLFQASVGFLSGPSSRITLPSLRLVEANGPQNRRPLNLRIVLLLEGDKVTIKSLKRLLVLALTLALRLNTQEPALALQVLRRKGTPSCQR